jgi:hypothetical protein
MQSPDGGMLIALNLNEKHDVICWLRLNFDAQHLNLSFIRINLFLKEGEMFKGINKLLYVLAVFLMVVPLVSCSGGESGTAGGTTGTLELRLTDAKGDYQNVWVTIKEILVHQAADEVDDEDPGWLSVLTFPTGEVIDLTTLEDGQIMDLGVAELEAGQYNQMRLILAEDAVAPHFFANYVVIEGDEEEEYVIGEEGKYYTIEKLKVPSGFQTGVKIVKGFEIIADGATALILDFDAKKSVVQAGKSGQWLLKPTIKVLDTVDNSVSGTVDAGETNWLEDVSVSAQIYLLGTPDLKDEVTVAGSDASDNLGDYFMYLPPGTYNIVAAEAGYAPFCQEVDATGFFDHRGIDFTLVEAATETATGIVTGLADGAFATLSFRQTLDCENGADDVQVEVLSVNIAVNNSYDELLSEGDYQLVVSAENETTLEFLFTVVDGVPIVLDIGF